MAGEHACGRLKLDGDGRPSDSAVPFRGSHQRRHSLLQHLRRPEGGAGCHNDRKATVGYPILLLDAYGNQIRATIQPQTPGRYALTGPGFSGTLPPGVTRVAMPVNFVSFFVRAVKFSPTGQDQTAEAQAFSASLQAQPLRRYLNNPSGGATKILPEAVFAVPFKTAADDIIVQDPIAFLQQLQKAVDAPNTPPLSASDQELSNHFNLLFGSGGDMQKADFSAGARIAHELIVENYLTHTDATYWIHFTNIAAWGDNYLDRSSITEFLQLANGIDTAGYYHTFRDGSGRPLDGRDPNGYVLTFPAGELPQAERFWSLTAYTPDAIELVPNPANKYVVASYTPGLEYNSDGSLSIYLTPCLPAGVPMANWLPVQPSNFNIMLRVYGPTRAVADNTYVPPAIRVR